MSTVDKRKEECKMNSLVIIAKLYRGELPIELDIKTEFIRELLDLEHSIGASHALLVASIRRDNFNDDVYRWVEWCDDKFGFTPSYRSHLAAIGKMLLTLLDIPKIDLFQYLFKIDGGSLLSISRLPVCDIPEFLAANDVAAMNRDQVRDAVNNWPGVKNAATDSTKGGGNSHQPDLFDSIKTLFDKSDEDFEALGKSKSFNEGKACQFAFTSMGLLTSSMTYWRNHGLDDPETAEVLEKGLRDFADNIEAMRKKSAVA